MVRGSRFFRAVIQGGVLFLSSILLVLFIQKFSMLFEAAARIAEQSVSRGFWHIPTAILAFVTGSYLCRRFAPMAAGSGVPKVREVVQSASPHEDASAIKAVLGGRTLLVKIIGCLVCAAGGGALGREGPIVHVSASFFWLLSTRLQRWLPWIQPQRWIMMGSAIGFTAAFHAPLAAVAFVVEELNDKTLSLHHHHVLWAILCAGLVLVGLKQDALFFPVNHLTDFSFAMFPLLLGIAVVCGVLAALLITTERMARYHVFDRFSPLAMAGICGVLVGIVAVGLGQNTIGGGLEYMQAVLAGGTPPASATEVSGRFLNTILTLISGNAGGTLAPALALGGGVGSIFAVHVDPSQTAMFILVGMASFLAALLDVPFTATILLVETTGSPELVVPLLAASLVSTRVMRQLKF